MGKRVVFFLLIFTCMLSVLSNSTGLAAEFLTNGTVPSFELIDRSSGLSNLSVSSLVQDRYGFLWIGTQGGLNRYDGRRMQTVKSNPFSDNSLIHNLIQTMFYDEARHELWIGTYSGLSRYVIAENTFTNYFADDDGISNPIVVAITMDWDSQLWIGTMDGLNRLNPQTGEITRYEIPDGVVRSLEVDSKGRLWIGSYQGLLYYNPESDEISPFPLELPSPFVMVVKEFQPGVLTLGLWDGGVAQLNVETHALTTWQFPDNRIYTLAETNDGTLWAGSWGGGLNALSQTGQAHHFPGDGRHMGLSHPVVYSLLEDDQGILWIGTNGGGLHIVNPRKRNYVRWAYSSTDPDSLSLGKINSIFRDSRGTLWFAIYNMGLNRLDEEQGQMIKYRFEPENSHSLPNDNVNAILELPDGRLLLATNGGLAFYYPATDSFQPADILPEESIVYSLHAQGADLLWVGTYTNGVYRYNWDSGELTQFKHDPSDPASLSNNLVYAVLADEKGRVWVGTNDGLNLFNPDREEFRTYRRVSGAYDQLGSSSIRVLFEDSKENLWIGTVGGGIARLNSDQNSFTSFLEENGLASNVITGILESDDQRIWVATHGGISVIEPTTGVVQTLTADDGIGGYEFNAGHFKDNNALLFGGIHGVTAIPSLLAYENISAPRVYITNVELFQRPIDPERSLFNGAQLDFGPNDRFLSFEFTALDFDAPDKTRFGYMLDGFDHDWVYPGARDYASYANIHPGEYNLLVKAAGSSGLWSDPVSLSISIAVPWFRSWWAYLFYSMVTVVICVALLKLRKGKLLRKENDELAYANERLGELNEELERLSTRDSLTGLYNRRFFDIRFEEQRRTALANKVSLALILFDLDNFKQYNDTLGHMAGDKLLINVGRILGETVSRSTDFAARYGGDEFVIVLFGADQNGALHVATRVSAAVQSIDSKVTASLGVVAFVPNTSLSCSDILKAADIALYEAKQRGKDQIRVGMLG